MMSGPPLELREIFLPLSLCLTLLGLLWWFLASEAAGSSDAAANVRETLPAPRRAQPVGQADYVWAICLAVGFYVLALWRLSAPPMQYFDEVHHVRSAMEYVRGTEPHEWTHPPIAKLLIAGSLKLWNGEFDPRDGVWSDKTIFPERAAFAWRFPSLVFASLTLLLQFALARAYFQNRAIAIGATGLLALDGLFFVQSRIGMTNMFTICFLLLGSLGTWQYIRRGKLRWLLLTGLGLGLAVATRWSTLAAWGFTGLLLLHQLFIAEPQRWEAQARKPLAGFARWAGMAALSMVFIPLAIYTLAYVPYVLQGAQTPEERRARLFTSGEPQPPNWSEVGKPGVHARGHGWYKVIDQQEDMWAYHSGIKETHPYSSPWWSWPLVLRPTWYHFQGANKMVSGVWAIGNVFIWWAVVPVLACAAYLAWRERQPALGMIALFGLGLWLFWGIEPRTLIFMHYLFETIPWACIALAYFGHRIATTTIGIPEREQFFRRAFVAAYGCLVAGWFVYYYPLLSSYPISEDYFRPHLWLGNRWI